MIVTSPLSRTTNIYGKHVARNFLTITHQYGSPMRHLLSFFIFFEYMRLLLSLYTHKIQGKAMFLAPALLRGAWPLFLFLQHYALLHTGRRKKKVSKQNAFRHEFLWGNLLATWKAFLLHQPLRRPWRPCAKCGKFAKVEKTAKLFWKIDGVESALHNSPYPSTHSI